MIDPNQTEFWRMLDELVSRSELVIDRPKGSSHPRYPAIVYAVDYGYLKETTAMDGGGIDVWRGTAARRELDAIICTVDLVKRDSEMKLLIGCTDREKTLIEQFHNQSQGMKGLLILRNRDTGDSPLEAARRR